jgi:hypothetical protein
VLKKYAAVLRLLVQVGDGHEDEEELQIRIGQVQKQFVGYVWYS